MEKLGEGVSDSVVVWEERGEKKEKNESQINRIIDADCGFKNEK